MHLPFSMYLEEFIPYISEDLISSQVLASIKNLAQTLPQVQSGVLECRLIEGNKNVDYQICVDSRTNLQFSALNNNFLLYLQSFYESWQQGDSILGKYVKNIWLELDAINTCLYNEIPCIFSHLHKSFRNEPTRIAQAFLSHFKLLPEEQCLAYLDHFSELLPTNLTFAYIGYLFSRPQPSMRIGIYGKSLDELIDYLGRIEWRENSYSSRSEILKYFSPITKYLDYFMISIDFNTVILPRVGLECFLSPNSYDYLDWEPVLEHLVSSNLCSPQKKEAVLRWHQPSQGKKVFTKSPNSLFSQGLTKHFSVSGICKHAVNHIKLIYEPDRSLEAKVYLSFTCQ